MDLAHLRSLHVISQETLAWFQPLWEKELEEAAEIAECTDFQIDWDDTEHIAEERPLTERRIAPACIFDKLEIPDGATTVLVEYARSSCATAHGNAIWAAAIAAAKYVGDLLAVQGLQQHFLRKVRILELGAGIGIPSLFLAQKLGDMQADGREPGSCESWEPTYQQIFVTDARSYHNIRQILFSVLRHRHLKLFRVAPHDWGEVDSSGVMQFVHEQCQDLTFDFVVAADCIYNPEFHQPLLDSICRAMAIDGRAIVTFSLHPNTAEENVWTFLDHAKLRGLHVHDPLNGATDFEPMMRMLGLWQANMGTRYLVHIRELSWKKGS